MAYVLGILIGGVLGLTGAGGSVFAVPLLMLIMGLPAQQAMGVSLGAVAISAFYGVITKIRSGEIQWLPAVVFALIGGMFAPLGNYINRHSNEQWLMIGFALLVAFVAFRLWRQASKLPEQAKVVRSALSGKNEENKAICKLNAGQTFKIGLPCVLGLSGGAAATGVLSGLFGVGGGFLIVPTLLALTGISIRQAVATSLLVISLVSSSGFVSFMLADQSVNFDLLSQLGIGGVVGMSLGIVVSKRLAGPSLQKIFSILMVVIATITVFQTFI